MNILAIETATVNCSVALWLDNKIDLLEDNTPHSHTKTVLPMVDKLLYTHKLNISDLDAIAFDAGPGSFTGLRIGAGVVQGLALANNTPIIKISSLLAMAHKSAAKFTAVALDARMNEVYFAGFCDNEIMQPTQVLSINKIELNSAINWTLVGNGWVEYGVPQPYLKYPQQSHILPDAEQIAKLAATSEKLDLSLAIPNYIRSV